VSTSHEAELSIGPQALIAYGRLNYTMWHALAEFIDNSTQSRLNYDKIIDDVLREEGSPLVVDIVYNRLKRLIKIADNSIGMTRDDLVEALRIANPTKDSKGRSKYGMGMKTAACWIGKKWRVITTEWGSDEEWVAEVDVDAIAYHSARVPLSVKKVSTDSHYTIIEISDLYRNLQKRTEENIRAYLGSMYRKDIMSGKTKLLYGGDEIKPPDEAEFDTDMDGKPMRLDLGELKVCGKPVTGWVGVLRKGAGGRKFGGFSLFQNGRQIQGFPNAWKPRSIFGGVDDEGGNNLVAQRLTGVLDLDGFSVSHTKDSILFQGDEEEELESELAKITKDYRTYAEKRRGERSQEWKREKIRDLVRNLGEEFSSPEMGDAVNSTVLPPLSAILANNQKQVSALSQDEFLATFPVGGRINIRVALQERSENDPYVSIAPPAAADPGTIIIVINRLHPYYESLETSDAIYECFQQYIFDAIAERQVNSQQAMVNPDSVRRLKDSLLRVREQRIENKAALERDGF
jgi:hypothetical protein